jgi:hypothetical protein
VAGQRRCTQSATVVCTLEGPAGPKPRGAFHLGSLALFCVAAFLTGLVIAVLALIG